MSREHMSRRRLLKLMGLGAAGATLAACQPEVAEKEVEKVVTQEVEKVVKETVEVEKEVTRVVEKQVEAPEEPVELSFMTWWLPPLVIGTAVEHAVEQFNESYPDITVGINPNPGGGLQKWQTALAAGTPPDMSLMRPHYQAALAARGAFVAVGDLLDGVAEVERDDFWPETIERLTWNGKLWGLPAEIWFSFFFVNVDMFEEAGVEVPEWDWTWEDFLVMADGLTKGEGVNKQYGSNPLTGWWDMIVRAWGGDYLDAEEKHCIIDQEPAPTAIQWDADLMLEHGVAPSEDELAEQDSTSLFETGRVAMYQVANWYLTEAETNLEANWSLVPNPIGPEDRSSVVQGANYAIFKQSDYPEEAWELMLYMSVGEGQRTILEEVAIFPTLQKYAELEYLPKYKQEWIDVSKESAKVANPRHFIPQYAEMTDAIEKELDEVWAGRKSAEEATAAIVPVVDKILAEEF